MMGWKFKTEFGCSEFAKRLRMFHPNIDFDILVNEIKMKSGNLSTLDLITLNELHNALYHDLTPEKLKEVAEFAARHSSARHLFKGIEVPESYKLQ